MKTRLLTAALASTLLSGALASTLFLAPAQANPFGIDKAPICMNDEAIKQIRQLEMMEQNLVGRISWLQSAIPDEQRQLREADAALRQAVETIGLGADRYPPGFDPVASVDGLHHRIDLLVRAIAVDEDNLRALTQELVSVQAWLRADRLLPPCETSSVAQPGGDQHAAVDTGDLLLGQPTTPPVLADPRLESPSPTKLAPGAWDRFKTWRRGVFDGRAEAEEKQERDRASKQAIDERRAASGDRRGARSEARGLESRSVPFAPRLIGGGPRGFERVHGFGGSSSRAMRNVSFLGFGRGARR